MQTITKHKTHTGEIVEGERLQLAFKQLADHEKAMSIEVMENPDAYFGQFRKNVSDSYREELRDKHIHQYKLLSNCQVDEYGFWLWQRLNTILTGECIALLPK